MSRYSVTLERSGADGYLAWIHELPGCYAFGTSREAAIAGVPEAVSHFCRWLLAAGEDVNTEDTSFDVVEEADAAEATAEGSAGVLLTWDQDSLTPQDWTRIERWLQQSRMELLRTLESMREEDLDLAAGDGARSIGSQLRHVASVEYMYALWTFDFHSRQGLREFLDWTHRTALERMRRLAERRDNRPTHATWAGDTNPEPWTARKAARRLVYHERWHLHSIRRLLQGFRGREASGARP